MNRNARTLADLEKDSGSAWGPGGTMRGGSDRAENGVLRCMQIVFPGFNIRATTFRYAVVCGVVFAAMAVVHTMRPG